MHHSREQVTGERREGDLLLKSQKCGAISTGGTQTRDGGTFLCSPHRTEQRNDERQTRTTTLLNRTKQIEIRERDDEQ